MRSQCRGIYATRTRERHPSSEYGRGVGSLAPCRACHGLADPAVPPCVGAALVNNGNSARGELHDGGNALARFSETNLKLHVTELCDLGQVRDYEHLAEAVA